jgi:hypothetical protein
VAMRLETKLFLPGDYIIREGDFGTEMFFVHSGACECIVNQRVVRVFHDNEFFGEIALLRNEPVRRTATIKSELYSELIVLEKSDFLDCIAIHPKAAKGVYSVMREKIDGYTGANKKRLSNTAAADIKRAVSSAGDLVKNLSKKIDEERKARNGKFTPSASKDEDRRDKTSDGYVRRGSLMPSPIALKKKDEKKTSKSTGSPSSGKSLGVQKLHASAASTANGGGRGGRGGSGSSGSSGGASLSFLERRPSISDGMTMDEFFDTNAARWNVPRSDLSAFVKEYMAKLMSSQ